MYQELEEITTFTPLGIRFWDPALDQQIRDGLHVRGRRRGQRQSVAATRTDRDIYVFHFLPGLRDVVNSDRGNTGDSPALSLDYVIGVQDLRGRFNPVAFAVSLPLPYRGLFMAGADENSGDTFHGVHLYSAPTRTAATTYGMLHAEIVDALSGEPANHAVVEVVFFDGTMSTGIADERGRVAVIAPLPPLMEGFVGSPVVGPGRPLQTQSWDLRVAVRYQPGALESLPGTTLPDYGDIFRQDFGAVHVSLTSPALPPASPDPELWPEELEFGRPLVLHTAGTSELLVTPAASSP